VQEVATARGLRARQSTAGVDDVARMGFRSQGRLGNNEGELSGGQSAGSESPARDDIARRGGRGRHRPLPRRNGNWTNGQLQVAFRAHEQGCSVSAAASLYDIPRTSFCAHLARIVLSRRRGAAKVLT
jgi:hypothetical protein